MLSIAAFGFIVDTFHLWAKAVLDADPVRTGFIFEQAGLSMLVVNLIVLVGSTIGC